MATGTPALDETAEDLYQHAPCGYLSTALDGTIIRVNATFVRWTGHRRETLVGLRRFAELLPPGARGLYETRHVPRLVEAGEIRGVALDLRCCDGRILPVLLSSIIVPRGAPRVIRTTVFDATERRTYERALVEALTRAEESEGRLRALQQITTSCAASITTDTLAETVAAATTDALGSKGCAIWLVDDEARGLTRAAVCHLSDRAAPPRIPERAALPAAQAWRLDRTVALGSAGEAAVHDPALAAELARSGIGALVSLPLRGRGEVLGVLGIYLGEARVVGADDLALYETIAAQVGQTLERARLHGELKRQALYDELTGLPNRTLLRDRLNRAVAGAARTAADITVLAIDIDGFKAVNDRLGHAAGDRMLIDVARRLEGSVRTGDTVARLGGDEFVVVCENADAAVAAELAARVRSALRIDVPVGSRSLVVTGSVGYAVLPGADAAPDLDELLERADRAMYANKELGRRSRSNSAVTVADTA
jgi:diguanylate cyclase (GGDEF)-like protein/PAS domain S-box-containing protein